MSCKLLVGRRWDWAARLTLYTPDLNVTHQMGTGMSFQDIQIFNVRPQTGPGRSKESPAAYH